MTVPITEPSNPATTINKKYATESAILLIMKLAMPRSGVNNAGVDRNNTKNIKKNIELRNPPINAGPVSGMTRPIGIAAITGRRKRKVAVRSTWPRVTDERMDTLMIAVRIGMRMRTKISRFFSYIEIPRNLTIG